MRNSRKSHWLLSNPLGRLVTEGLFPEKKSSLRRAPRRRDIERLEERQMLSVSVGTDAFFGSQWGLLATGQQTEFDPTSPTVNQTIAVAGEDLNVVGAWSLGGTGEGVQIAIIDGGFDLNHEDLVFVTTGLSTNLDQLDSDTDPGFIDTTDSTGTGLAGIVGARNNSIGIIGVAPEADLFPVRLVPGQNDGSTPTLDAINRAFRFQAGFIQDSDGDGVPDAGLGGALVPIDIDGDGIADGIGQDPQFVTDVFLHSGRFQEQITPSRVALPLPSGASIDIPGQTISILEAINDTAKSGRSVWIDTNGDGLFTPDEVVSLGSIHVVPAGNDAGRLATSNPFQIVGQLASAQYDELANSRHTIAVGAVDYDGRYENPSTGTVNGFAETGANVLVVAPSGTTQTDISTNQDLNSGVLTTDITGEGGANVAPLFNFEFDGDYFANTNYQSEFGGTEAAAAKVAGVVAQMLSVNPLLSNRDVQQILLMSARQNDQFDESWIVNQMQAFAGNYEIPEYAYYDLDIDGDGVADIENAIIPNTELDPNTGLPVIQRGFFLNDADLDLGVPWVYDPDLAGGAAPANPGLVNTEGRETSEPVLPDPGPPPVPGVPGENLTIADSNAPINPDPIIIFAPNTVPTNALGLNFLFSPLNVGGRVPLEFENGAGFTVSWGYGRYLEEMGYAHGVVDAEVAVQLAKAWATNDQYLAEEISITTSRLGGTATTRVQPRAFIVNAAGQRILTVPGGVSNVDINTAFFEQFFSQELETEDISEFILNAAGDGFDEIPLGEVITNAPFYDPDGDLDLDSDLGGTRFTFEIDPSVTTDFLSLEWIEFTTELDSGDIDNLRLSLIAPDGTQSELNAFRPQINGALPYQTPQGQQGRQTPAREAIGFGDSFAGIGLHNDVITGTDLIEVSAANTPDALAANQGWTWTTNRHWGEIFSAQANSDELPPGGSASPTDRWTVVVENHGDTAVTFGGIIELTFHGTEATGQRIQGKVGIDNNAQGVTGTAGDENFNFDRYVELTQLDVELSDGSFTFITVLLDDANDSVTYTDTNTPEPGRFSLDNIYKSVDPDTGVEVFYAVVDRDAYFSAATDLAAATTAMLPSLTNFVQLTQDPTLSVVGIDRFDFQVQRSLLDPTGVPIDPLSLRNFDYSQEDFASNITVVATQFETLYDLSGNIVTQKSATGVVQKFTTGSDGNYYFDVEATKAPPLPGTPAYDEWFLNFGGRVYSYEIALEGDDINSRVLTNADGGDIGYHDVAGLQAGLVTFQSAELKYDVDIFSKLNVDFGQTTKITNVNFLLEVDPAKTNVDVNGTVFRDRNGDNVINGSEELIAGATVFFDADGNGTLDTGEQSAVTAVDGSYSFTIPGLISPRSVSIVLVQSTLDASLEPRSPSDGELSLSATPGSPLTANFTVQRDGGELAQVSGIVFEDVNEDGVFDTGESGIGSSKQLRVFIDVNSNNVFDAGIDPSTQTASDGTFNIESTIEGDFNVFIDQDSTILTQTTPENNAGIFTTVSAAIVSTGLQFGVFDSRNQDFGDLFLDASHNYPTLLGNNGARHVVVAGLHLGARVDVEGDGIETTDASGDNITDENDEDGVVLLSAITAGAQLDFNITAVGQNGSLNAWVDFNNDGDWDDAGEQIFTDAGIGLLNQVISVVAPLDVDETADGYAARFRWGPFGLSYDGAANAGEVEDYILARELPIVVEGQVRQDLDGGQTFDTGDKRLDGVVVYFDQNLDGIRQVTEPSSTTNAAGEYRVSVNASTTTNVTIRIDETTLDAGLDPLSPVDGIFSQAIAPSQTVIANFLVGSPQGVSGHVFSDANNNALIDVSEGGFGGIKVQLFNDPNNDNIYDTLVGSDVTDVNGNYVIPTDGIGDFEVRVDLSGTEFIFQSLPGSGGRVVNVTAGNIVPVDAFGVFNQADTFTADYGDLFVDASNNFPTTLVDDGARHTVVTGVFLGTSVDTDPGTLTSTNATADDISQTDDEDGVVLVSSQILANSTIEIDVTATGVGATLDAWIDFNDDGDWDDAGERISTDLALSSGATTRIVVSTPNDVAAPGELLAARFRWGAGTVNYTGAAASGEVEDYFLPTLNTTTQGGIDGDYNGDGSVTTDDRLTWVSDFGATSGIGLRSDGNGDGVVNAADYTIYRDALANAETASSFAFFTKDPDYVVTVPQIAESAPQFTSPSFVEKAPEAPAVSAAPVALMLSSAVDNALAVEGPIQQAATPTTGSDAIEQALLEWAIQGPVAADASDEVIATIFGGDSDESDESIDESLKLALADEVFAL